MFAIRYSNRGVSTLTALVCCLLLFTTACTGSVDGDQDRTAEAEADSSDVEAELPMLAAASVEFVSAAVADRNASSFFADALSADQDQGVQLDVETLTTRLGTLEAFAGTITEIRPSPDAYPDAGEDLSPSCGRSSGRFCQVDLVASGGVTASVIVYWFGNGVSDYSILTRSNSGAANGIGEARCESGFALLHGGHTDRFDIAICMNDSGRLRYAGAERGLDRGIELDACQDGSRTWVAENSGFEYLVDGSGSEVGSELAVSDPAGDVIESGRFTAVHQPLAATPVFC